MFSPEMFGDIMILKLAAELVQPVLAVVSAVTPHAAGDAPLTLKSIYGHDHDPWDKVLPDLIIPLVDAEDGVGQGVVAEKLSLLTHQSTQKAWKWW